MTYYCPRRRGRRYRRARRSAARCSCSADRVSPASAGQVHRRLRAHRPSFRPERGRPGRSRCESIRSSMTSAGITAAEADAGIADNGSPTRYSYELAFDAESLQALRGDSRHGDASRRVGDVRAHRDATRADDGHAPAPSPRTPSRRPSWVMNFRFDGSIDRPRVCRGQGDASASRDRVLLQRSVPAPALTSRSRSDVKTLDWPPRARRPVAHVLRGSRQHPAHAPHPASRARRLASTPRSCSAWRGSPAAARCSTT